jgi:hypothetical protein
LCEWDSLDRLAALLALCEGSLCLGTVHSHPSPHTLHPTP